MPVSTHRSAAHSPAAVVALAAALLVSAHLGTGAAQAATAVANPSLETGWTPTTAATCWTAGGAGTGTATLAASSTAHTGTTSGKLTVTALATGANKKVVIDQRTAGCAPTVTPGVKYDLSLYYQSSQPAILTAYYRDAAGWHYWQESPKFAARSTWGVMTLRTAAVPAGATELSFGGTMPSVGWLLVDDAAMSPAPTTTLVGAVRTVSTPAQLSFALATAAAGDTIRLADGVYPGTFTLDRSGTPSSPIRIAGTRAAILDGGTTTTGYVLHLDRANYVLVDGITIRNGKKAVVLDQSSNDVLTNLDIATTGEEAVLLRNYSRDNVVSASLVHDTGRDNPAYGEGIYIGMSKEGWAGSSESRTGGAPDTSDRNQITGNRIYATTAENVDIKEGTTGGLVTGNAFDGAGLTGANYADSWVDVAGNGYTISANTGINGGKVLLDGYQTHVQLPGWGNTNLFEANTSVVNAAGYAVNIMTPSTGNVVKASNTAAGARSGLTNIPVTP